MAGSRRADDTRRLEYNRPAGHRARSGRDRESQRANRIVNGLPDRIPVARIAPRVSATSGETRSAA